MWLGAMAAARPAADEGGLLPLIPLLPGKFQRSLRAGWPHDRQKLQNRH
jgi:hypothetical protein